MPNPNFQILSTTSGTHGTITIAGDYTTLFVPDDIVPPFTTATSFSISSSAIGNNGNYVVLSSAFAAGNTVITVKDSLPVMTVVPDGVISYVSSYYLNFYSADKPPIIVRQSTVDSTSTSLELMGRFRTNWGTYLLEGLIRILENFAGDSSPLHPTIGQIWFNTDEQISYVYTTHGWHKLAYTSAYAVAPVDPTLGQFWFNTATEASYVYTTLGWRQLAINAPTDINPPHPQIGQFWFNTTDQMAYVYTILGWQKLAFAIENNGNIVTSFVHTQYTPSTTWEIVHNLGTEDFVLNVYMDNGDMFFPLGISKTLDTVTINFSVDQVGKAVIVAVSAI